VDIKSFVMVYINVGGMADAPKSSIHGLQSDEMHIMMMNTKMDVARVCLIGSRQSDVLEGCRWDCEPSKKSTRHI
jgi:hypothetical protein